MLFSSDYNFKVYGLHFDEMATTDFFIIITVDFSGIYFASYLFALRSLYIEKGSF